MEGIEDLEQLDYTRPIVLYSQTTKGLEGLHHMTEVLKDRTAKVPVKIHDTICRQVANRIPGIKKFAVRFDLVLLSAAKRAQMAKCFLISVPPSTQIPNSSPN